MNPIGDVEHKRGSFVIVSGTKYGIGKLLSISESGTKAKVGFFISMAKQVVEKNVLFNRVKPVALEVNTRAYVKDAAGKWFIGRIQEKKEGKYKIALPDREVTWVNETYKYLFVRSAAPIGDPTEILICKSHETAAFHNYRSEFMRMLIAQRGASWGMPGLLSSRINLLPHQVEVVRRVLEDPVQRYLLADEVGLGKTIEAGVILRQFLLDRPNDNAYILVPPHLYDQWREELDCKFLNASERQRVTLLSYDQINKVTGNDIGMLIIDEAHHLASKAFSANPQYEQEFDKYRALAHSAPRILLLSATPVLNHEKDFLGMLHLLDPVNYQLKDLEQFRIKVEKRQDVGRLLLSLKEGSHSVVIKSGVRRLREIFPSDILLQELTKNLEQLINTPGHDKEQSNKLIRQIRVHLSETYRLHRRMMRNRRESVINYLTAARYDSNNTSDQIICHHNADERSNDVNDLLDSWRDAAHSTVIHMEQDFREKREQELVNVFKILWEGTSTWLGTLKMMIQSRLQQSLGQEDLAPLDKEQIKTLTGVSLFDNEKEILKALLEVIGSKQDGVDLIQQVCELLASYRYFVRQGKKCVIFTGYTASAVKLESHICSIFGRMAATSHLSIYSPEIQKANLTRFKLDVRCFILICDASAEEGLNLQYADVIIHLDLPCSPNRIEQRIGRLDRIGRVRPLQTHIFTNASEYSLSQAWYKILHEGLGVFTSSIASLQFYVEERLNSLITTAFYQGAQGLHSLVVNIQQEIETEQVKISEQQVLDEIDAMDTRSTSYYEGLEFVDRDWKTLSKHCDAWISHALLFRKTRIGLEEISYSPQDTTLIPRDKLREVKELLPPIGTYNREKSVNNSNCALYRIGEPFIDWLYRYLLWDDRGKSFAIWRCDDGWDSGEGSEWVGFRFDYIVESDMKKANAVLSERGIPRSDRNALLRQADAFLMPFMMTFYVNSSLVEETNERVLLILKRPFLRPTNTDINLTKGRLVLIEEIVSTDRWAEFCHRARSVSEQILKNMPLYNEKCNEGFEKAKTVLGARLIQLRLRFDKERVGEMFGQGVDIELEEQLFEALLYGVRHPKITLDAIGFIVISGRDPMTSRSVEGIE